MWSERPPRSDECGILFLAPLHFPEMPRCVHMERLFPASSYPTAMIYASLRSNWKTDSNTSFASRIPGAAPLIAKLATGCTYDSKRRGNITTSAWSANFPFSLGAVPAKSTKPLNSYVEGFKTTDCLSLISSISSVPQLLLPPFP